MVETLASVDLSRSVSSILRMKVPPLLLANSQLNRAVRAPPTCRKPVGEGAKRTRTPAGAAGSVRGFSMQPRFNPIRGVPSIVFLLPWKRSGGIWRLYLRGDTDVPPVAASGQTSLSRPHLHRQPGPGSLAPVHGTVRSGRAERSAPAGEHPEGPAVRPGIPEMVPADGRFPAPPGGGGPGRRRSGRAEGPGRLRPVRTNPGRPPGWQSVQRLAAQVRRPEPTCVSDGRTGGGRPGRRRVAGHRDL